MPSNYKNNTFLRKIIHFIFHSIWTISIILYILSILGGVIPGLIGAYISPLTTLYPLFLIFLIIVFFNVIRKKNKLFIITISFVLLISSPLIWRYCPIHLKSEPKQKDKNLLRILSYNVNVFRMDSRSVDSPSGIINYILSKDVDIVCLQEATVQSKESYGLTLNEIKSLAHDKYPYIRLDFAQVTHGSSLMILSKYPILKTENLYLKSIVNGAISYLLNINGSKVWVINTHLESFKLKMPFKDREESINNLTSSISNTSKAIPNKKTLIHSYYLRNNQADQIIKYIDSVVMNDRVIVCGDCNATPTNYAISKLGWRLKDCYKQSGNGPGFSFRSNIFFVRIDNIFCSNQFNPIYTRVLNEITLSDHYPIYSVLSIYNNN